MPDGIAMDGSSCKGALVLAPGVTSVMNNAFYKAEITSVSFSNSVEKIGNNSFFGTRITSVTLPDSLRDIGTYAFGSTPLNNITFSKSLITIGDSAFRETSLESIKLPNSLKTIGPYAFAYTQLTALTLPNSIVDIGPYAFYFSQLSTVSIPATTSSIGNNAFAKTPMNRIEYCGNQSGFLIAPNCTPERELFDKASLDKSALDAITKMIAGEIVDAKTTIEKLTIREDALESDILTSMAKLQTILDEVHAVKDRMSKAVESCDIISLTKSNSDYLACLASPEYLSISQEFENAKVTYDSKFKEYNDQLNAENDESIKIVNQIINLKATITTLESTPIPVLLATQLPDPAMNSSTPGAVSPSAKTPTQSTIKKTTITCIRGKMVKTVTSVKPVCPAGYKRK
jgi:hypothetical protein